MTTPLTLDQLIERLNDVRVFAGGYDASHEATIVMAVAALEKSRRPIELIGRVEIEKRNLADEVERLTAEAEDKECDADDARVARDAAEEAMAVAVRGRLEAEAERDAIRAEVERHRIDLAKALAWEEVSLDGLVIAARETRIALNERNASVDVLRARVAELEAEAESRRDAWCSTLDALVPVLGAGSRDLVEVASERMAALGGSTERVSALEAEVERLTTALVEADASRRAMDLAVTNGCLGCEGERFEGDTCEVCGDTIEIDDDGRRVVHSEADRLRARVAELEAERDAIGQSIGQREADHVARRRKIEVLEAKVSALDAVNASLCAKLGAATSRIAELEADLSESMAEGVRRLGVAEIERNAHASAEAECRRLESSLSHAAESFGLNGVPFAEMPAVMARKYAEMSAEATELVRERDEARRKLALQEPCSTCRGERDKAQDCLRQVGALVGSVPESLHTDDGRTAILVAVGDAVSQRDKLLARISELVKTVDVTRADRDAWQRQCVAISARHDHIRDICIAHMAKELDRGAVAAAAMANQANDEASSLREICARAMEGTRRSWNGMRHFIPGMPSFDDVMKAQKDG